MTGYSNQLLGHGMGTALEPKDWEHISLVELGQLKSVYAELRGSHKVLWRSPRPFSSGLIVEVEAFGQDSKDDSKKQYFIKRSHYTFRTVDDLLQEHAFIQHLSQRGITVPKLIFNTQNTTACAFAEWSYEVFERAQGIDIYADHLSWKPFFYISHAAEAGKTLAKLHHAATHFKLQTERSTHYLVSNQRLLDSEDIVTAIHERIQQSSALQHYFNQHGLDQTFLDQVQQVHHKIKSRLHQQAKIWTHNDLHASNLLWSDSTAQAKVSCIIDFGLCDYNSAIYDLAVTIERNFIDWLDLKKTTDDTTYNDIYVDKKGLEAFIHAYFQHASPLQYIEILPELLNIVHLDFAFSELEYFIAITRNLSHADAAYYDWLISHTAWFFQAQGQAFTQYLAHLIEAETNEFCSTQL